MPRNRDHPRSRRGRRPDRGVGGRSVAHQPRKVGEGLDVVDDRRPTVETDRGRKIRRLEPGHAAIPLETLDQRRLFAHDVGTRSPVQNHIDREVRAEDVLADVAGGIRLVERRRHAFLGQRHLAADVEEAARQTGRVAGDQGALDQLVRVALHQQAVLVRARLALVAVDHEVARPAVLGGQSPLGAGGETRSAPSEDRRRLHFLVDGGGPHAECLAKSRVAVGGEVPRERVGVLVFEARGDDPRPVTCDETRCMGPRRGGAHRLPPSIHAGAVVSSSGATAPTARSAGICCRVRASVPCGGISSAVRPATMSSISASKSALSTLNR